MELPRNGRASSAEEAAGARRRAARSRRRMGAGVFQDLCRAWEAKFARMGGGRFGIANLPRARRRTGPGLRTGRRLGGGCGDTRSASAIEWASGAAAAAVLRGGGGARAWL